VSRTHAEVRPEQDAPRMKRVYFDKCCLGRFQDDWSQDRVRLEAEAVAVIMRHVWSGEWLWVGSDVLHVENEADPDEGRKARVAGLFALQNAHVTLETEALKRALELRALGFREFDAYHVAAAEKGACDVLLTTDIRFIKTARRHASRLKVQVTNPVDFLLGEMTT
jgi:hypothetical protein